MSGLGMVLLFWEAGEPGTNKRVISTRLSASTHVSARLLFSWLGPHSLTVID